MTAHAPGPPVDHDQVNSDAGTTPASMAALAATVTVPVGLYGPLRPYVRTVPGGYRLYCSENDGKGPHYDVGPTFPRGRAGARRASALCRAIIERIDHG
jgi:hypothetical protein